MKQLLYFTSVASLDHLTTQTVPDLETGLFSEEELDLLREHLFFGLRFEDGRVKRIVDPEAAPRCQLLVASDKASAGPWVPLPQPGNSLYVVHHSQTSKDLLAWLEAQPGVYLKKGMHEGPQHPGLQDSYPYRALVADLLPSTTAAAFHETRLRVINWVYDVDREEIVRLLDWALMPQTWLPEEQWKSLPRLLKDEWPLVKQLMDDISRAESGHASGAHHGKVRQLYDTPGIQAYLQLKHKP